jgi:hypothetical protein
LGVTPEDRRHSEVDRIIREVRLGGYGVNGTPAGCLAMNAIAIPFYLLNTLLFLRFGGMPFLVVSCLCLGGFITQSMYSHRYLHMTRADIERSRESGTSTAFMRWFMTTPVARLQARRHYRHHHESFDYSRTANGVIMSFSIADFLFRRGVYEADIKHLLKMRREGFLDYAQR